MKALLACIAVPAAAVLLIGAGMSTPAGDPGVPEFPTVIPAAPSPFVGTSGPCVVPDPTGTGGCVTAATGWLLSELGLAFGPLPMSCWDEHAWNPRSDHPRGRGCDVTFGLIGQYPSAADVDRGWVLATWLQTYADELRVRYLIWQGRIWHSSRPEAGWTTYSGGGVYDPSDPTGGHYDHVHISTTT